MLNTLKILIEWFKTHNVDHKGMLLHKDNKGNSFLLKLCSEKIKKGSLIGMMGWLKVSYPDIFINVVTNKNLAGNNLLLEICLLFDGEEKSIDKIYAIIIWLKENLLETVFNKLMTEKNNKKDIFLNALIANNNVDAKKALSNSLKLILDLQSLDPNLLEQLLQSSSGIDFINVLYQNAGIFSNHARDIKLIVERMNFKFSKSYSFRLKK